MINMMTRRATYVRASRWSNAQVNWKAPAGIRYEATKNGKWNELGGSAMDRLQALDACLLVLNCKTEGVRSQLGTEF